MAQKTSNEPPKIEFPCAYSIRVIGRADEDFADKVFDISVQHAPEIKREDLTLRDSSKGTFISVHFVIQAQGPEQLAALDKSLKQYDAVKMVI